MTKEQIIAMVQAELNLIAGQIDANVFNICEPLAQAIDARWMPDAFGFRKEQKCASDYSNLLSMNMYQSCVTEHGINNGFFALRVQIIATGENEQYSRMFEIALPY